MLVADLHHFLELPADIPGPARLLAERLGDIVRAATAGEAAAAWETALRCPRRPRRRACTGRIVVLREDPGEPIRWECSGCGDAGMISNWEDSPFDLRRRRPVALGAVEEILLPPELAAALQDLRLLDVEGERLVFALRAHPDGAVLAATEDELEDLIGFVAAEANYEANRRRQRRIDDALDALTGVLSAINTAGLGPRRVT